MLGEVGHQKRLAHEKEEDQRHHDERSDHQADTEIVLGYGCAEDVGSGLHQSRREDGGEHDLKARVHETRGQRPELGQLLTWHAGGRLLRERVVELAIEHIAVEIGNDRVQSVDDGHDEDVGGDRIREDEEEVRGHRGVLGGATALGALFFGLQAPVAQRPQSGGVTARDHGAGGPHLLLHAINIFA